MTIRLHDYWRSSASYRVRIGLNLVGLGYEPRSVDLIKGEQRGGTHLERNPQGLVPALEIDGLLLTQSLAILEYLDETRGAGWLPPNAAGRARVRAIAQAVAVDIHPICNLRVARHAEATGGIPMTEWMGHFIPLGLEGVEGLLARGETGRYCHGDTVSLADICLVPQVYNALRWNVSLDPFPRIRAIAEACEALPAFAAAHPDKVMPK
ncbi:MAG TPA: maleylacetoacetate isomerase [Tabrizicola sp.]|nr:maleylacetoacetate isomerase [Tabrizicola sp.]